VNSFGAQTSSTTPQRESLVFVPPFAVAACLWALTMVVSIMR
jgi:hypothetical protein